ncbi:MAG TPA: hypothetical protein DCQ64_28600 [Candidatus Rokubacteria bacterium]|nr:hypothetical protein [Candidatus Rokubacteria bacterium]
MDNLWNLLWLFLIVSAVMPMIQARLIELARLRFLRRLERQRGSRVITLIHRQESRSILGIPVARYIDLILHTPGGLVLATQQIAGALRNHAAKVTVMVPHHAMSGGTLLALSADEILMDRNAALGPVDPQVAQYPAVSLLRVTAEKDKNETDDETLILADVARTALAQIQRFIGELVADRLAADQVRELIVSLTEGRWTHDYPITCAQAQALGLPVRDELPPEVYSLMDLYPQPRQARPSVQFVPVPYRREPTPAPRARSHP